MTSHKALKNAYLKQMDRAVKAFVSEKLVEFAHFHSEANSDDSLRETITRFEDALMEAGREVNEAILKIIKG